MPSEIVLQKKNQEVEEIKKLLNQFKVIAVAPLYKVRASQLQELKKKLSDTVYLKVIKNTLMKKAISETKEKANLGKMVEKLSGSNVFLFTNMNPFKLVLTLEKSKVKTTAKSGDIASSDIIVPAGNTGLPPGPIISQLNAIGLQTRIEAGSVWVNRDTIVAKAGDIIDERLASALSKLGIKPIESGLRLSLVYDDGLILTDEQLHVDLNETRRELEEAASAAFNLSLSAVYVTIENASYLLQLAHQEAFRLAYNAAIPTSDNIVDLIRKAHTEMLSLAKAAKIKEVA